MSYRLPAQQVYTLELTGKDEDGVKTVICGQVRVAEMSSDGWGGVSMNLAFVPDRDSQLYSITRGTKVSKHYQESL